MKLIRKTGPKVYGGNMRQFSEFLCPECNKIVERWDHNGKKQNNCGCVPNNKIHGYRGTELYDVWRSMKKRCYLKSNKAYNNYGGRGIKICDNWKNSFVAFKDWAESNGYDEKLTIDREDNDGNYEPSNCRFVTKGLNNLNRRSIKLNFDTAEEIRRKYKNGGVTIIRLSESYGVSFQLISLIINGKIWSERVVK